MNPVRVIEAKREGRPNTRAEIEFLVRAASDPATALMSEAQLAAWCMAVVWQGMTTEETAHLTQAMAVSGDTVDLVGLPKPWVDKHSTGGVGDKTTIVLLPMLAACGLTSVKMSGRGLGKTGGTIDKLESIPGFQTALSIPELKAQAAEIGIALTGQTPQLTPADATLYSLRDVTATVKSVPLIVSSILSKKIAGGAEVISIDLKCGSGAFMETESEARVLAAEMLAVGQMLGLKIGIEITDMDQPLGDSVGNLIEIQEAICTLQGNGDPRFTELCVQLATSTLELAGRDNSQAELCLHDGSALAAAHQWFDAQGASLSPAEILAMPLAPLRREVLAPKSGWLGRIDAGIVGETVVDIGGGRRNKSDLIDPTVGVKCPKQVGNAVEAGETVFVVYASNESSAEAATSRLSSAIEISPTPVAPRPVLIAALG